ncbi:enterochelin esterase [Kitasatospora sp. NPDC056651]|uniref:enterochelin esterase n=1 Tax=Kitasatospora sp. NPDC056651 TaxID=3345892 RepID=UPI0036AF1836
METHSPLIAADPADPAYRLVTFTHRGGDCDGVLALLHTVTDKDRHSGDLTPHLMERQSDGETWSITYRLRADHRASYQLHPFHGEAPGTSRHDWLRVLDQARPDPYDTEPRLPARDGRHPSSVLSLPAAPAQPYVRRRQDVPRGRTLAHEVAGRRVDVHLPAGHRASNGPYPVALLLDGEMWGEALSVADTLDNLTADGAIPPTVTLLVHTLGPQRPTDLSCNPAFVDLLADHLLPWAAAEFGAGTDPAGTVIAGQSAGGLTAAYAAYHRPERFGNALCQSGSFWWPDETEFDAGSEWLTRRLAAEARRPVRFWIEVGLQEWMLLGQNRHLRDVLTARGYDFDYREFNGGHDYACWRGGLADGLAGLLRRPTD